MRTTRRRKSLPYGLRRDVHQAEAAIRALRARQRRETNPEARRVLRHKLSATERRLVGAERRLRQLMQSRRSAAPPAERRREVAR